MPVPLKSRCPFHHAVVEQSSSRGSVLLVRPVQSSLCWMHSSSLWKALNFSRLKFPAQRTSVCRVQTCVFPRWAEFRPFSFLWTVGHKCCDGICHQMQSTFILYVLFIGVQSSSVFTWGPSISHWKCKCQDHIFLPQDCIREEESEERHTRFTVMESEGSRARTNLM